MPTRRQAVSATIAPSPTVAGVEGITNQWASEVEVALNGLKPNLRSFSPVDTGRMRQSAFVDRSAVGLHVGYDVPYATYAGGGDAAARFMDSSIVIGVLQAAQVRAFDRLERSQQRFSKRSRAYYRENIANNFDLESAISRALSDDGYIDYLEQANIDIISRYVNTPTALRFAPGQLSRARRLAWKFFKSPSRYRDASRNKRL